VNFLKPIFRALALALWVLGILVGIVMGLTALFLSFQLVSAIFGPVIAFLSLVVAPALLAVAPLYALFAYGDWTLMFFSYGFIPIYAVILSLSGILHSLGDDG
tara:strand:+ start:54 stop:362 length:309 start_codon:yes stop_codon:yes gene_type:complete